MTHTHIQLQIEACNLRLHQVEIMESPLLWAEIGFSSWESHCMIVHGREIAWTFLASTEIIMVRVLTAKPSNIGYSYFYL